MKLKFEVNKVLTYICCDLYIHHVSYISDGVMSLYYVISLYLQNSRFAKCDTCSDIKAQLENLSLKKEDRQKLQAERDAHLDQQK